MALFCGFNWWSVPGLIFESCWFFFSSVTVTIRGLDLFSGAYHNMLSVSVVPRDWKSLGLRGPPGLVLLCLKTEADSTAETSCSVEFRRWTRSKIRILCQWDTLSPGAYGVESVLFSYCLCWSFQVIGFFEVFLLGVGIHYLRYNIYSMSC